jgi:hypothetical protein
MTTPNPGPSGQGSSNPIGQGAFGEQGREELARRMYPTPTPAARAASLRSRIQTARIIIAAVSVMLAPCVAGLVWALVVSHSTTNIAFTAGLIALFLLVIGIAARSIRRNKAQLP